MKFRKPLSVTCAVLLAAPLLRAETSAAAEEPAAVIITGSGIARTDYEGPQAITVFDRAKIDKLGARTVSDLLQRLPQNAGGFSDAVNTGTSFSPGAAAASLRGLGVAATLVLINGRRAAPFPLPQEGTETFVDLNSIPLTAVDRVEVLRESASAVYGSDAIAGVVNIILRESYSGLESETYLGSPTKEDALMSRSSFVSGITHEKLRLMVTGQYEHRNPLGTAESEFARSADKRRFGGTDQRSVLANPGSVFLLNSQRGLAVPKGSNGRLRADEFLPERTPSGAFRNLYDYQPDFELLPEKETWGGALNFAYSLTPRLELFGDTLYQAVRTETRISPTGLSFGEFQVPASNPFNPFGEPVTFDWRSVETGPRRNVVQTDSYRYLAGLRIKDLPNEWVVEGAALYTESNVVDYSRRGFLDAGRVQAALNETDPARALNVFGAGRGINNPEVLERITRSARVDGLATMTVFDLKANGRLFDLPAGPVRLAVGAEYREETLANGFSAAPGEIVATGGASSDGDRDVRSANVELSIPLTSDRWNLPFIRALELSMAERYDDYSDFGDVAKPRFSFKWKPVEGLLFRGTYSEGFRAPTLPQLFIGENVGFGQVVNPVTGDTDFPRLVFGGNRDLQPETSYSYFLGTIIEPPVIKGLSLEANFFRIEQRNLVGIANAQDVINGLADGLVTFAENRGITEVRLAYANLGTVVVDGIDLGFKYERETAVGTFTFDADAAFINSSELRAPGRPNRDETDFFGNPEFKLIASLFYTRGRFGAGVTVNYIDSYDGVIGDLGTPTRPVGSWTTVDLQASYEWIFDAQEAPAPSGKDGKSIATTLPVSITGWRSLLNQTKLTVGVLNAGDAEPPFANLAEGYDTQTAQPDGRFIYASVRKKFW